MSSDPGSTSALDLRTPPRGAGENERPAAATMYPVSVAPAPTRDGAARRGAATARETRLVQVFDRAHFIGVLRFEMRRADRSAAALSLVIYRLAQGAGAAQVDELRNLLAANTRETDILGQLGPGVFAVICVETGDAGVHHFMEKIDRQCADLPYSVESATYPDHLFEGLSQQPGPAHGPSPLVVTEGLARHGDTYALKRPLDVAGALLAIALLSPLMLVTALLIKLTSRGPVIFRQTRLGKGGRPFAFYKFRSMIVDNDDRIHREYVASLISGQGSGDAHDAGDPLRFKIKSDPRVTAVGRVIRRTSIDELPQLFNVLNGDMSLVGPRPPLPYEAENYQSWHLRRVLDIRPGITGLWQVEGRSRVTFDEMVRMDLRYIRSCSLGLDLRLLARTVLVVLRCDGAA